MMNQSRRPPASYLVPDSVPQVVDDMIKMGERSFAFVGPAARNSLPTSLYEITDHKACKRELKPILLNRQIVYNRILTFFAIMLCAIGHVTV